MTASMLMKSAVLGLPDLYVYRSPDRISTSSHLYFIASLLHRISTTVAVAGSCTEKLGQHRNNLAETPKKSGSYCDATGMRATAADFFGMLVVFQG
ncbi:MAG: hypothetical protein GY822_29695 [Deltaproteobacteria bacterium]|nr:hypothetical protein [Deltaproteobacteria bacterium]